MDQENRSRPPRKEAQPVFGGELEEAVRHIDQNLILTGPSGSGKTVLGTAVTTIGLAAAGVEIPQGEDLVPDLAVAGYPLESDTFSDQAKDDISYLLEDYLQKYGILPPVVMIDEILPEYAPLLSDFANRIRAQYTSRNAEEPKIIWVLQGDETVQQSVIEQSEFLRSSHGIALSQKAKDPDVNNAGYRSAVARADLLRKQLGNERFDQLVQEMRDKITQKTN